MLRQQRQMHVDIEILEVVAKQDDLIVIRDKILLEGCSEGNCHLNRSGNLHVLTKREDGEWKIFSTLCIGVATA